MPLPFPSPSSRREILQRAGGGFGMLALAALLDRTGPLQAATAQNPLAP